MRLGFRRGPPPVRATPAAPAAAAGGHPRPWRTVYADGASFVGRGMLAGLIGGALVGGGGGRLAMFVLRLTSSDSVRGLDTDDGFTIGAFTGATLSLVVFTALLGALGGLLYLVVRPWLPPRGRPLVFGLLAATLGGQLFINPDGIDFTVLDPRWLAVTLFVLLPAAYGVALSVLTERLLHPGGWRQSRWLVALPLAPLLIAGPVVLPVLLVSVLVIGADRAGRLTRLWRSAPLTWLGRSLVAAAIGGTGILLARDVAAVL